MKTTNVLTYHDVQEKWLGTLTSVPNKGKKVPRHAPACLIGCAAYASIAKLYYLSRAKLKSLATVVQHVPEKKTVVKTEANCAFKIQANFGTFEAVSVCSWCPGSASEVRT